MGRPALNVKPILVRLPNGVPERIDTLVGANKRAVFIREAVLKELERREKGFHDPDALASGQLAPKTD